MDGFAQLSFRKAFVCLLLLGSALGAQTTAPARPEPSTVGARSTLAYASLAGKTVEDVRVLGNTQVSSAIILNVVRTHVGDKFDPTTVEEDYQRIYSLKKFANVEAKAEPTAGGVIVSFIVTEQKQIKRIAFTGNTKVDTNTLLTTVDIHEGEAIDSFRISIAKQSIESLYRSKNFPYAHVDVDRDLLGRTGEVTFQVVEGPNVRVRMVDFVGNRSFTDDRLKDEVQTRYWIWIFRPGTFDPDTVDGDVAALRKFYEGKGFFDARVGRKITESADQSEIKVTFLIDEGPRYRIDKITITGNNNLTESQLRSGLKLKPGAFYDNELLQRDVRQMVREYSPFGFIFSPQSQSPDYLRISTRTVFRKEAGSVELQYVISEGKPFRLGRIIVRGNTKTQEKVVLREMRVSPGQVFNAAEIADATDRLKGTPFFSNVTITPIGEAPDVRDLLVEVTEARTASFGVGAGINSNGGLGGNVTYEQRNFDIADWPSSLGDTFSDRAFIGAGQNLRVSLEPGTEISAASIRFTEPWLFDQPYSFTAEAFYRDRDYDDYVETDAGGRITFGKRINNIWSTSLTLLGENVEIHDIQNPPERAPQILDVAGNNTVTSTTLQVRRNTTNSGMQPSTGSNTTLAWESFGTLGGEFTFQKFTGSWDWFTPVHEDLLDRKTIFSLSADAGWIWGSAPFFEQFYAGGIGSIRGFQFRGISPRAGLADDAIGGAFLLTGSAQLNFPLYGENLRGVVFTDVGTVESDVEIGTIRSSVGFGFRLVLPIFGRAPVAVDFALPLTKDDQDETQWFSFSLGVQN